MAPAGTGGTGTRRCRLGMGRAWSRGDYGVCAAGGTSPWHWIQLSDLGRVWMVGGGWGRSALDAVGVALTVRRVALVLVSRGTTSPRRCSSAEGNSGVALLATVCGLCLASRLPWR